MTAKRGPTSNLQHVLRQLGDLYVNDAFATCHWKHASTYILPQLFSHQRRMIGLNVAAELAAIDNILHSPRRPLVSVLGGDIAPHKFGLIAELRNRSDRLLVGGAIAYTFLRATGISVGGVPDPTRQAGAGERTA